MVSIVISRIVILVFGTLYPAYASYKAIKTKNVKEYVKWMMYWIVFALFTTLETFSDMFLSWFPFYYEIKIVFVLWLLSPATRGSSILYRKFVHPRFMKHEQEIDDYIAKIGDQGYSAILTISQKGISYASGLVAKAAVKGHSTVMEQMKKSLSLNDLSGGGGEGAEDPVGGANDDEEPVDLAPAVASSRQSAAAATSRHSRHVSSRDNDTIPEDDDYLDGDNRLAEERLTRASATAAAAAAQTQDSDVQDNVPRRKPRRQVQRTASDVGDGGSSSGVEYPSTTSSTSSTSSQRRQYTHKEPYHYATLRKNTTSRRSQLEVNLQPHQRHSVPAGSSLYGSESPEEAQEDED